MDTILQAGVDDFDPLEPRAWFGRRRVSLQVMGGPLRLPGRCVWGVWDVSIRRVTIYGCAVQRDAELVRSIGHEMWHVLAWLRKEKRDPGASECAAEAFGAALVESLGPDGVELCAGALRAMIQPVLRGGHLVNARSQSRRSVAPPGLGVLLTGVSRGLRSWLPTATPPGLGADRVRKIEPAAVLPAREFTGRMPVPRRRSVS